MKNKLCGIYKIECIVKGTIKGVYIGQSVNLSVRKSRHFTSLKRRVHPNKSMQNHYDKYGESSFSFHIIEQCSSDHLTQREQYWFDEYSSRYKVFNSGKIVDSPSLGLKISAETRRKLSETSKGRKHTQEVKNKISKANKGHKHTEESRQLMSEIRTGNLQFARFSKDEARDIRRLYKSGKSISKLCELYDCGKKTVIRVIHHEVPYDFK